MFTRFKKNDCLLWFINIDVSFFLHPGVKEIFFFIVRILELQQKIINLDKTDERRKTTVYIIHSYRFRNNIVNF